METQTTTTSTAVALPLCRACHDFHLGEGDLCESCARKELKLIGQILDLSSAERRVLRVITRQVAATWGGSLTSRTLHPREVFPDATPQAWADRCTMRRLATAHGYLAQAGRARFYLTEAGAALGQRLIEGQAEARAAREQREDAQASTQEKPARLDGTPSPIADPDHDQGYEGIR